MKNHSILITRPNHDQTTNYLCVWSEDILDFAQDKGWSVFDLKGAKATSLQVQSYLRSRNPVLLVINGHGSTESVCGQDNEVLFSTKNSCKFVEGKILYARSCDAAAKLGTYLLRQGLAAFIGYRRKFVFGVQVNKLTRPKEDNVAKLFLEPANLIAQTLIKGHSAHEAHQRAIKAMYRNFRFMLSAKASLEERYYAKFLWANMKNQQLLGNGNASIAGD